MLRATAIDPAQSVSELNDALNRLEAALLTPVVSGELESWARTVEDAMLTLSERLPTYLKSVLHPEYCEIAKSDAELLPKVEQLIAEDHRLLVEQDEFRSRICAFVKRCSQVKKDEAQIAPERDKLEQDGHKLILNIKRQRAEADTWLAEAAYRDRGSVD